MKEENRIVIEILDFALCGSFGSSIPKQRTNEPAPQWSLNMALHCVVSWRKQNNVLQRSWLAEDRLLKFIWKIFYFIFWIEPTQYLDNNAGSFFQ